MHAGGIRDSKATGAAALKVDWTPLEAGTRIDAVAKGKVDIECGTTTMWLSRYERVDFSLPIFVDGGSVITRTDAKINQFADLRGKRVAVIPGTTTETGLKREFAASNAGTDSWPSATAPRVSRCCSQGRSTVTPATASCWCRCAPAAPTLRLALLDRDFSFEPYALVLPRDDPDFRLAVNRALVEIYRSGEIDDIFYRWLGALGRPGPLLHSMFYLSTLPE